MEKAEVSVVEEVGGLQKMEKGRKGKREMLEGLCLVEEEEEEEEVLVVVEED